MKIYLVGGAVRDKLLGLDSYDKDFVVVGSSVKEMLGLGFKMVGKDFPVFIHPKTKEEYALARTERKIAKGYKGFEFDTKNVSLKADLSRRDLTINSMAIDDNGKIIDYFGGQKDLSLGFLKHTSPAFSEDPVRVLRVARFAAKLKPYNFKISQPTLDLMRSMVASGEVKNLVAERVFAEIKKSLGYDKSSAFFKTLASCGAYEPVLGLNQQTKARNNDFAYLDNLGLTKDIKFSLWINHHSLEEAKTIINTLKVPKKYKILSLKTIEYKDLIKNTKKYSAEDILRFFSQINALRDRRIFDKAIVLLKLLNINTKEISKIFDIAVKVKLDNINTDTNSIKNIKEQRLEAIKKYVG